MSTAKEIEINGEKYIKASCVPAAITEHIIIIAQRGWIFEGYKDTAIKDKIRLVNASVVRSWSNGRGIGGLAKAEYKSEYKRDTVGTVEFAPEGIIAVIGVEW